MREKCNLLLIVILLWSLVGLQAQVSRPSFTTKGSTQTTNIICVTTNLPTREAQATAQTENFVAGTVFTLELSDLDGVFDPNGAMVLTTYTTDVAIKKGFLIKFPEFSIPTDLRGDTYRIRVRYAIPQGDQNIGNFSTVTIQYFNNTVPVKLAGPNLFTNLVAVCAGESVTLNVTPTNLPEYKWFFKGLPIDGQTGTSLENVSEPGEYKVIVDFGECNQRFSKNVSSVNLVNFNKNTVKIEGGEIQEFCPNVDKILQCSIDASGIKYEWFKNGIIISGENKSSLKLPNNNFSGIYDVKVTGTNTCGETTNPVEVINLGSNIISKPPPKLILFPNQDPIDLIIEIDTSPTSTIEWFYNGKSEVDKQPVNTPGALQFIADKLGTYMARISINGTCKEEIDIETEVILPSGISLKIANILNCEEGSGSLALEDIFGLTAAGDEVPLVPEQYDLFDFEWLEGSETTGITDIVLELTPADINKKFTLQATIKDKTFPIAISNEVTVEFLSEINIKATSLVVTFFDSVVLTAPLSVNYTYEWYKDDVLLEEEIKNTVEVQEPGTYFVKIFLEDCTITSNGLVITSENAVSELIPNVITPYGSLGINDTWVLPDRYSNPEIAVMIYNNQGQLVYEKSGGYNGEWPLDLDMDRLLYFYIIKESNIVVKKGTITVMR